MSTRTSVLEASECKDGKMYGFIPACIQDTIQDTIQTRSQYRGNQGTCLGKPVFVVTFLLYRKKKLYISVRRIKPGDLGNPA